MKFSMKRNPIEEITMILYTVDDTKVPEFIRENNLLFVHKNG